MLKKIIILSVIALVLISCQKGVEEAKNFSNEYTQVVEKLRTQRAEVKTRDQYVAYKADKKREFEALLEEHAADPNVEAIEILRSRVLLDLEKLDEAEKKIDAVLADKPKQVTDAKMIKTRILLNRDKFAEAYAIFKEVESQVTDLDHLFAAYYGLGTEHEDINVRKEYSNKFLDAEEIPAHYTGKKIDMYLTLTSAAKEEGDFDKAREILKKALAESTDDRSKAFLEPTLAQLDYIGQPAPAVTAEDWINSGVLKPADLNGKVVIVSFWAPWCPSCRTLIPTLVDIYESNKDKDFVMIGFTRYYGRYKDDVDDKGKVEKDEELELVKGYVERKKITYPVAVADDKAVGKNFKISALPTLVFIDKKGNINYTKIGSGSTEFLKNKVKTLLAE